MKILVTGSNGFVGKRLVKKLKEEKHIVIEFTHQDGDIAKKDAFDSIEPVDVVYHLAALTFVPASWDKCFDYFNVNVMGTVNVLEYCKKNNAKLIMMSTYVYGEPQYLPVDEKHPINAASPYHETKIVDEEICKFYSEKFQVPVVIFRPFNIYGEGQNEAFLLPKIMKQVLDSSIKTIEVMDLTPKRDYIYIDDVISALLIVINFEKRYEIYNLGTGISVSVEEAIKTCMEVAGVNKDYKATGIKRSGEISDCVAEIRKIKEDFCLKIENNINEGIELWIENYDLKKGVENVKKR